MNRKNPYVIQLKENIEPARRKSIESVEFYLRHALYGLIIGTVGLILSFFVSLWLSGFIVIVYLYLTISGYKCLISIIKTSPLSEINDVIYGDQYEKIYVNNERLLKMIESVAAYNRAIDVTLKYIISQCKAFRFAIIFEIMVCIVIIGYKCINAFIR